MNVGSRGGYFLCLIVLFMHLLQLHLLHFLRSGMECSCRVKEHWMALALGESE